MDRAQAIRDAEFHRETHNRWRLYLIKNGDRSDVTQYTGDIAHQEECIARYDNILEVLRHRYPNVDIIEKSEEYHDEEESVLSANDLRPLGK